MTERSRIQCLDRAMDVLELVARRSRVGVTELARELDLHVATVHNIVTTLTARRYLCKVGMQYSLGPALTALVSQYNPALMLPRLAAPVLLAAARATGEAPLLAVLTGTSLQVVAWTVGHDEINVEFPNKNVPDPLAYGTGHVLVAYAPEALWDAFLRQHQASSPEDTPDMRAWHATFQAIRRAGRAVVLRPSHTDSYAVPVWGPGGEVVAALGMSCPSARSTPAYRDALLAALTAAAAQLAQQLAGAPASQGDTV